MQMTLDETTALSLVESDPSCNQSPQSSNLNDKHFHYLHYRQTLGLPLHSWMPSAVEELELWR